MITKFINFITKGIWRIRLEKLPRPTSFILRNLRIILLAFRGFSEARCSLRASALVVYTLLSVVPAGAIGFALAKVFHSEKLLENILVERFPAYVEAITEIFAAFSSLLVTTKASLIAIAGLLVLFWAIAMILSSLEHAFNEIWGIKRVKTFGRRLSDYLATVFLCPLFLIGSFTLSILLATRADTLLQKIAALGPVSHFIFMLVQLLPFALIWFVFSFVYIFIPNTKVISRSGILAGVVAGTLYQLFLRLYMNIQMSVGQSNTIYSAFVAVPLFLIWLQLSWRIVLWGAEISFAHQNVQTYEFEQECINVSHSFKMLLSLRITNLLAKNFSQGGKPWTAAQIARVLEMPIRLVHDILFELTEVGVLATVRQEETYKDVAYQPGVDIKRLTIKYVMDKLQSRGTDAVPVAQTKELEKLKDGLKSFSEAIENSPANVGLKDI